MNNLSGEVIGGSGNFGNSGIRTFSQKKTSGIPRTELFSGREWDSGIKFFNSKVGNAKFCTMGTLGTAIIPR